MAYVGTMMGAELQRAINILGINPQQQPLSATSPPAVAPDSGDAPQIVAGEGYSAVVELVNPNPKPKPRTPDHAAAVAAAGAPGAAPLFRSFQAQRLQSAGGKTKKAGAKKRKGKGKGKGKKKGKKNGNAKRKAAAEGASLAASGTQPRLFYPRKANAAIGIQPIASRQLQERARQSSQVWKPVISFVAALPLVHARVWACGHTTHCACTSADAAPRHSTVHCRARRSHRAAAAGARQGPGEAGHGADVAAGQPPCRLARVHGPCGRGRSRRPALALAVAPAQRAQGPSTPFIPSCILPASWCNRRSCL